MQVTAAAIVTALLAATNATHRARADATENVWPVCSAGSAGGLGLSIQPIGYYCYAQPTACTVTGNLVAKPDDLTPTGSEWVAQSSSGVAAPTVTTNYDADPAGGWSAARVQFAAVPIANRESTLWQNLAHACDGIACRYSIFLRATPNGNGPSSGNLPVANAQNGGDGFNPHNCAFTTSWSRCDFTVTNTGSASYVWMGYASYGAGYSGTGPAMDLELWLPSVVLGSTSATYSCDTSTQLQLSTGGTTKTQVAADWGIVERDGAGLVTVPDGTQVLLGGWNPVGQAEWGGRATTNRILKSTNEGASWVEVLPHVDDPPQASDDGGQDLSGAQRWRRRHSMCAWTAPGADAGEFIYIIGGDSLDTSYNSGADNGPFPREVWRSPAASYGAQWERMCGDQIGPASVPACGWNSRMGMLCWNIGTTLYLAGGQEDISDAGSAFHDVWRSTDEGRTWSSLGNAPWAPRGFIANALPRLDGKIWLTGGLAYAASASDRHIYNDVWSFNGTSWAESLACAPWPARGYQNTANFGGKLWVFRGYSSANLADGWYSPDGTAWSRYVGDIAPSEHAGSVTVSRDGGAMYIEAGATSLTGGLKGVWKLTSP